MKNFIKKYWKVILFFTLTGLVGGFFTGLYVLDGYPEDMQQQLLQQGMDKYTLAAVNAVQSAGYGLILGTLGIILSKKIGLWHDELKFEKKPVMWSAVTAIIGGLAVILLDVLVFGKYSQPVADSYRSKPDIVNVIASLLYGGVIEEVMLRLFLMSLAAFLLHIIFERKKEKASTAVLVIANIVCALLFAAGHLPATAAMMGITPMILVRCFLLNGGIGLMFGWLYRKYGIQYAMLAHAGCHVVMKLVWLIFI